MKKLLIIICALLSSLAWAFAEPPEEGRIEPSVVAPNVINARVDGNLGARLRGEVRLYRAGEVAARHRPGSGLLQPKKRLHAPVSIGGNAMTTGKWVAVAAGAGLIGAGIWASSTASYTERVAYPATGGDCNFYGCAGFYYPQYTDQAKRYSGIAGVGAGAVLLWHGLGNLYPLRK